MKLNAENAIILIPENQDRQTFVNQMLNYLADFGAYIELDPKLNAIDYDINVKNTIWLESEDFGLHIIDLEIDYPEFSLAKKLKVLLNEAAIESEYDNLYFKAIMTNKLLSIRAILEYSK